MKKGGNDAAFLLNSIINITLYHIELMYYSTVTDFARLRG